MKGDLGKGQNKEEMTTLSNQTQKIDPMNIGQVGLLNLKCVLKDILVDINKLFKLLSFSKE